MNNSVIVNGALRSKVHAVPTAPFVLHRTRIGKCVKKNLESITNCRLNFFYYHPSFVTCKSAFVNCACKKCSTGIGYGARVLTNGSISLFSNCQWRKKDNCALANCGGFEFFEVYIGAFTIVTCGMKKKILSECAVNFTADI